MLRQYLLEEPDKAYLDWLYPQLRNVLANGQVFLLLTFTPIAWVGYFYYYADYVASLPVPQPMSFNVWDFYRMVAVPLINLAVIAFIKKGKSRLSAPQLEKLMLANIALVATTLVSTSLAQPYYNAEFYAFEIIVLIVFAQILLGLTFRKSVICSLVLAFSALFYLVVDDVAPKIKVYDATFIVTVWGPALFGARMLERARRANFRMIAQLEATSRELQIKNEDLQQFAYASSHDLQEPLRTISNFVGVLNRRLAPQLTEEQKRYFDIILNSAERMKNLIHAILDYSRIGREKSLETICPNEILREALDNLGYAIQRAEASIEAEALPSVRGYRTEFSMLLQNLIGNALKFHRPGVPPVVKIGATAHSGQFRFFVADNGIGIEAQYTGRIFHLFSRLHTKEQYEGTGIGLTHCKKIVELHGGKIWVESTPGAGATFYFTIPKHN